MKRLKKEQKTCKRKGIVERQGGKKGRRFKHTPNVFGEIRNLTGIIGKMCKSIQVSNSKRRFFKLLTSHSPLRNEVIENLWSKMSLDKRKE